MKYVIDRYKIINVVNIRIKKYEERGLQGLIRKPKRNLYKSQNKKDLKLY